MRTLFAQSGLPEREAKNYYELAEHNLIRCTGIAINLYTGGLRRKSARELQAVTEAADEHKEFGMQVVNSLSSGIAVIDRQTRRVRLWSPRMAEITELSEQAVLGKTVEEAFVDLHGLPLEEAEIALAQSARLPVSKVKLTLPSKQVRHVLLRAERLEKSGELGAVVVVLDDTTERELLIESFSQFVSKDVVERILSSKSKSSRLTSEKKLCSVLFADIRGFTALSERISPEQLAELLNVYFQVMIDEVSARGGMVDKFIGDKIMAVFSGVDGGARKACQAAVRIQRALAVLNDQRQAEGAELIGVGIGVNTGTVMMGPVGSATRMNFTVIGDAVNVADRLQAMAKAGEVLIGERTCEEVAAVSTTQSQGTQALKGRKEPVTVFKLISIR